MKNDDFEQWAEERRRRLAERRARRAREPEPGPEPEQARRRRAGPAEDAGAGEGRKERVLHTRISEKLDEALRRASEDLRVPVSNLVRNVLEDVFTVVDAVAESVEDFVEDVVDETSQARERLFGASRRQRRRRADARATDDAEDRGPAERAEFPDVLGWQALLLNAPQTCADCEEPLPKGTRAHLGIPTSGPPRTYLCRDCMQARAV